MDTLKIPETGAPIETPEQASNFVFELVEKVEEARRSVDGTILAMDNIKFYERWMILYGQALGTVVCLHRCRKINDATYMALRERVMRTTIPTVREDIVGVRG